MTDGDANDEFYGFRPVVAFDLSFDALLGLELVSGKLGDGKVVRARLAVRPELLNPDGVLPGGVLAAVAEALASRARHWR
ncbi:MAG: hypothetical protein ACR2NR_21490 [Solirubrobacteraceae bacterium]